MEQGTMASASATTPVTPRERTREALGVGDRQIGQNLKLALASAGMSQEELADRLGITRSSIANYINGFVRISAFTLGQASRELGVTTDWLIFRENTPLSGNEPVTRVDMERLEAKLDAIGAFGRTSK